MDVVAFSRVKGTDIVAEVGVGTGNFLALFAGHAALLIGIDVTEAMLREAQASFPTLELVQGDGAVLPLRSASVDLVTFAQTLHHIREPIRVLTEMRRVMTGDGRVLIVDQVATENVEEATKMNEQDWLSVWMSPDEFPDDRVAAVRRFIADHGDETGMAWKRHDDDWNYTRRRIMVLARRGG